MNTVQDNSDQEAPSEAIIDNAVIDMLFDQLDLAGSNQLLNDSFAELEQLMERFRSAGAKGDRAGCLTALQGLRGFAADYGAVALLSELTTAKQALVVRDYKLLGQCIPALSEALRDARTALLLRLARYAAVRSNLGPSN